MKDSLTYQRRMAFKKIGAHSIHERLFLIAMDREEKKNILIRDKFDDEFKIISLIFA